MEINNIDNIDKAISILRDTSGSTEKSQITSMSQVFLSSNFAPLRLCVSFF
jgi:hypothetical protein